jgi:hypothetical protein
MSSLFDEVDEETGHSLELELASRRFACHYTET